MERQLVLRNRVSFAFVAIFIGLFSPGAGAQNLLSQCSTEYQSTTSLVLQCNQMKVIKVRGKALDRARELGNLHRKGILSNVVLDQFATKAQKTISSNKVLQALIGIYIDTWIGARTKAPGAKNQLAELEAFSKGSGISTTKLKRALFIPDLGTYAEGETLGCTSAVYSDASGYSGAVRNLDFAGVGTFDRKPAVLVNLPDDPNELSYLGISAEGVPWAGITGLNEAGLYFAVHQNFTSDVDSKKALPLLFVGDGLLRTARNIDEALEHLKKNRPLGMWTFVLVDFKNKKAATVELSARRMNVRWSNDGILAQSNHLLATPDSKSIETGRSSRTYNSATRLQKAYEILTSLKEKSEVSEVHSKNQELLSILGYQESKDGAYSAFRDIQRADTIQSILVEGDVNGAQKIWAGVDPAPTATGTFLSLNVNELFSRDFSEKLSFEVQSSLSTPEKRRNQTRYATVYELAEEHKNVQGAYELLKSEKSVNGLLMKAYLEWQLKKRDAALLTLDRISNLYQDPNSDDKKESFLEESSWVLRAKVLYEMGRRDQARSFAEERLAERTIFSNPDRQNYLKAMSEKRYEDPNDDFSYYYESPGALKWNFAFGDFKQ